MIRHLWRCSVFALLIGSMLAPLSVAQDPTASPADSQQTKDEAAIRELKAKYAEAYNNHDPQTLAAFWSPEAVYTNRLTGEQVSGREAIADEFAAIFESESDLKLELAINTIDFISPNVAIAKGRASLISATPEQIPYSAVYVKRDGTWLIDRVTDDPQPASTSHYDQLQPLEWMIGTWIDDYDGGSIQTTCNWTKNKNFIVRSFTVAVADEIELSGMQVIGWDAAQNRIRSWTFDSDGGHCEADWSAQDNTWYAIKKGTTADGKSVSAVNIITYVDDDTFTLKSVQRSVDGQLLPDTDEVTVVRQ